MAEYVWGAVFVIAVIALSGAGAASILRYMDGAKECKLNNDCRSTAYCGSDFKCHEYPNIQQTVVKNEWVKPALIVGLSIVLAALILRRRQQPMSYR